ncbi:MAG: glutamate--tRNA ligase family protein [Proteobacteria bacterium]|nr:glutamate--tRNA ligase family protein [Pseudomonadota bacterium]
MCPRSKNVKTGILSRPPFPYHLGVQLGSGYSMTPKITTPKTAQPAKPLVRFAPSPTGQLHVGNMRTALINYLFAVKGGGTFMLRFDDTDTARNKDEFYDAIRTDLAWMGIVWDEAHEIRQSTRSQHYQSALDKLIQAGRAYPCFESQDELALMRKSQLAQGLPPRYNRAALKLTTDEIKARMDKGDQPYYRFLLDDGETEWDDLVRGKQSVKMTSLSDPVVKRADGRFIYTLASVVDDVAFATTHILRGEDHTTNSAAQLQIFAGLGATPPAMGHFPLLLGKTGEGLSKRLGSLTIDSLRDEGWEAETIASLLVRLGTGDSVVVADSVAELGGGLMSRHSDVPHLALMRSCWGG